MSKQRFLLDDYVPLMSSGVCRRVLSRLSLKSINNLACLWCQLQKTQPDLKSSAEYRHNRLTRPELVVRAMEYFTGHARAIVAAELDKQSPLTIHTKKQLIDAILIEFWHKGLNLLQLSQIDCQLIIDKPGAFKWSSSKIISNFGKMQPVANPSNLQKLSKALSKDLASLYLNHVYLCRHPMYPLILIRIQLFDLVSKAAHGSSNIISRRPFFVAIPSSSTFILHSSVSRTDTTAKIIIQSLEKALSSPDDQIHLQQEDLDGIQNLESVFLLSGNTRFSSCEGPWSVYADNNVDILPFDNPLSHQSMQAEQQSDDELEVVDDADRIKELELKRLKKIASVKFKGTKDGSLKSKRLYQDLHRYPLKRLKLNTQSRVGEKKESEILQRNVDKTEYASIIPIPLVSFTVHSNIHTSSQKNSARPSINESLQQPKFTITLSGNDVFAGLHELCVTKPNAPESQDSVETLADPLKIPSWLCGEEGSGLIVNNRFYKLSSEQNSAHDYFSQFKGGAII